MPSDTFRVRKINDRQLVDKLREVTTKCGFEKITLNVPMIGHNPNEVRDAAWFDEPVMKQVLEINAPLIQSLTIWFGRDVRIGVTREANNLLSDQVTLTMPDGLRDPAFVLPIVRAVREAFDGITSPVVNADVLGKEVKEHYDAREQYLTRQEREVSEFFIKMADFNRKLTEEHRAKMDQLEADFASRQKKLDEQHQARMEELNKRDAEFEKRKAEFDLQEARGMRRKLREDQKKELQELVKKFTLTPDTEKKRTPVWFAAVATILVLAGITLYLMFGVEVFDRDGHLNYLLVVRQITFSVATIGFVWFFIVWSNRWFQRHADEELRLKRLSLDLDRASWVFEMILDWQKETKQEFPPELLKQLAKNLYAVDGVGDDDMTKADLLAALLGSAASLKLKGAGGEVEFDRKGLREVEKKS
jgi:hypothetical protein